MITSKKNKLKAAFISSYLPRKCGIATFTSGLINSMKLAAGEQFEPQVLAMQSTDELQYHKPVKLTIRKNVKYDYLSAADYINSSNIDIVSVQHEFGLFGGDAGSYLNILLKRLSKPVITTLHTILEDPSAEYFDSLTDVCMASDKIIIMNKRGIRMLRDIYSVSEQKIKLIPHGIPDLPFTQNGYYKRQLGMAGRRTILTFGLLSRNKGIEVMLRALPIIIKSDPSVLYIVLGATHPEVLRHEGQSYKFKLDKIVKELGLQRNVVFHNRFVSNEELFQFLGAADIYVTPYLNREQLTSGTLAFAVGTGKAVVSTPYWAAQELLAQGRGKFVAFRDSEDTARAIGDILRDRPLFFGMKRRAYEYGRAMIWPKIGRVYWQLFRAYMPSMRIRLKPSLDLLERAPIPHSRQMEYQKAL